MEKERRKSNVISVMVSVNSFQADQSPYVQTYNTGGALLRELSVNVATMNHTVDTCSLTNFDGNLQSLEDRRLHTKLSVDQYSIVI